MTRTRFKISGVGSLALAALLAANPLGLGFDEGGKGFRLELAKAYAKGGDDDSGGDRSDSSGRGSGGDRDDGDRSDSSGSGSGGDRDDSDRSGSSGSGSGDDGDRSGHGGGDDDDDDRSARSYDRDDDRGRGRGRGGEKRRDAEHRRDDGMRRGGKAAYSASGSGGAIQVTKVEETPWGLEVEYSNGAKEEIENGRYERKDTFGRTVLERPASASDFDRIQSNVVNSGLNLGRPARAGTMPQAHLPPDAQARKVELNGRAIEVRYRDGWKEEIEAGRYQLKDPSNRTVVERRATQADHDRLMALAGR